MTMLWGRAGQKGFPRERLGRRPAVLGFYAWQYSGCPMKAGNLSESEGSDAFWVPLYSSIYLRESHVQGNRFDLENPGLDEMAALLLGNKSATEKYSLVIQTLRRLLRHGLAPELDLPRMDVKTGGTNRSNILLSLDCLQGHFGLVSCPPGVEASSVPLTRPAPPSRQHRPVF